MADVAVPPVAVSPSRCGACRSDLTTAKRHEADGIRVAECGVCGFYAWCGQDPSVLPIGPMTKDLAGGADIEAALLAAPDTSAVCEGLIRLEEAIVASVRRAAAAPPSLVDATLWRLMDECERLMAANRRARRLNGADVSVLTRVIGLLLAIVLEERTPGLGERGQDASALDSFATALRRLAVHGMETLVGLRNVRLGLAAPGVRDGSVVLEPTPDYARVWEWEINRKEILSNAMRHATPALEEAFSRALLQSQKLVWGVSLNEAGAGIERMLKQGAGWPVLPGSGVRALDPASCSPEVRRVLELHTLTYARLAQFQAPLFWDLGEPEERPSSAGAALMKAATQNWTAYYPLVAAEEQGGHWCVVPWQMFRTLIDIVGTYKSQLLEGLYDQARTELGKKAPRAMELAALRQEANRAFEDMAAEAGRQCGWLAAAAVTKIDGRKLAAGDLDVVLARVDDSRLTLILGEVKDLDLTVGTPKARERMQVKIDHAYAQLHAKATEIRPRFRELVRSLGVQADTYASARLVSVVLTSDYLPPYLFHEFPGVPIDMLPLMLKDLVNGSARGQALYGRGFSEL